MPYLIFDNAQIYYEVAGQGTPFVMLHAGIAHRAMWDPQFRYFQKNYRVVRFDQRGFGKTITTTKEFNRRADLFALLDELKIERAILMGCSMGGSLALDFTLEHPERVSALILIAAGFSGFEAPADIVKQWDEQDAAFAAGDLERVVDLELKMWVDGPNRAPSQVPAHVREKVRAMEMDNLKIDTDGYNPVQLEPPAIGRLGEIQVPTLVIYGTGDQPHVIENGQTLAREIPNAQVLILENVGHVPSMEEPDEVDRGIERFLESI
ncbi:MAG: alpha/beta hydrolase [Chloroflexota bacterium]|nr:MAG: alpha/beta hydrolase [Chloroflexota bacterium]